MYFYFFYDLHLQIIQSISTLLHWVKSSVCQQSTVTECILNLLNPSTAWREEVSIIIFINLVSTNILLAMLGFPLSPKRHADFCFKPSRLFLYCNHQKSPILFYHQIVSTYFNLPKFTFPPEFCC